MESTDENDVKLQRVSRSYIVELQSLLNKCLWKKPKDTSSSNTVHRRFRQHDLDRTVTLIEPFQEDPQLLDTHLKSLIPQLVDAYLLYLRLPSRTSSSSQTVTLSSAIGVILNIFCKVRGEKVIVGFLNNEPRYLESILSQFETCSVDSEEPSDLSDSSWQERYVLLLWLSHLMLAPFDLASISSGEVSSQPGNINNLELPVSLPRVTLRVLPLCLKYMSSATKERTATGKLLVRLALRPDMRKIGLVDSVIRWALSFFTASTAPLPEIHEYLGVLSFISQLLASATVEEIGSFIPALYQTCQNILTATHLSFVQASAVARKLIIKSFRNVIVHGLRDETLLAPMDVSAALEDVIDHLLQALADGDTPVRYAASKALSAITLKLDPALGEEIVEAVLGSLGEDVLWQGSERDLSSVNPLRWHGLTLTLAHLLYKKAPPPSQLPEILNALFLALNFEQRSTTGSSIGTNVRDAACFGIWALSRRYATADLLAVKTTDIKAADSEKHGNIPVPQFIAIELVTAACLDPAGNIRRGSSAALQELVGRHPDTVSQGIPLVQVVDFHAVGLQDRALCQVAIQAAALDVLYWDGLFANLLRWRGIEAVDGSSRVASATAIALLSSFKNADTVHFMVAKAVEKLHSLSRNDVEGRHGVLMTLSSIINQNVAQVYERTEAGTILNDIRAVTRTLTDLSPLQRWDVFEQMELVDRDFTSTALRPELTSYAVCTLVSALAKVTIAGNMNTNTSTSGEKAHKYLNLCLRRNDAPLLDIVPGAVENFLLLERSRLFESVKEWIGVLGHSASYSGSRGAGFSLALGATYHVLASNPRNDQNEEDIRHHIIEVLTDRCTPRINIEARTTALRSLQLFLGDMALLKGEDKAETIRKIAEAFRTSLNDYTINERGDVGSLVRTEALNAMEVAWKTGILKDCEYEPELHGTVLRLSLEKLDKLRTRAAQVLAASGKDLFDRTIIASNEGVSSYAYFAETLKSLTKDTPEAFRIAILEGYVSCVGMASESVVQASRLALVDTLGHLPVSDSAEYSLLNVCGSMSVVLKNNLAVDRVLLPLMECLSFLFDMGIIQRLVGTAFRWRNLLSLVQKSHFKSTHMQKLHLALELYRGLAEIDTIKDLVLTKVASMLLHPFPKVRITAAETLYVITNRMDLEEHDWSQSLADLKPIVAKIQKGIL